MIQRFIKIKKGLAKPLLDFGLEKPLLDFGLEKLMMSDDELKVIENLAKNLKP